MGLTPAATEGEALSPETRWITNPRWESDTGIVAGLTTRNFSAEGASLEDRLGSIRREMELPDAVSIFPEQVHSRATAWVDQAALSRAERQVLRLPKTDAVVTDRPGALLHLTVADCVPVLAFDRLHGIIGVAHAGWRGTVKKIASGLLREMAKRGADLERVEIWLGPSICQGCFEVGPEVLQRFTGTNNWWPAIDLRRRLIDLALVNRLQIARAGVPPGNTVTSPLCTRCRVDLLHSHRGEPSSPSRMTAVIGLRDSS